MVAYTTLAEILLPEELMFASENGFTATDRTMVIGPNSFSHVESCCSEAKATDPKDKERILAALRENDEKLENINSLVRAYRMHGCVGYGPIPSAHHSPTLMPWKWIALLIVMVITCPTSVMLGLIHRRRANQASSNAIWCNYLQMNDTELWQKALHKDIGKHCQIYKSSSESNKGCNYYVKGRMINMNEDGVPTDAYGRGDGCVYQPGQSFCLYMGDGYCHLTKNQSESMCTLSTIANAAAQLRYGLRNGYCGVDSNDRCVE